MSNTYETRTIELGPVRVEVKLVYDEDERLELGEYSMEPRGICYDRNTYQVLDAEDQVDMDDLLRDEELAWRAQHDERLAHADAQMRAAYMQLDPALRSWVQTHADWEWPRGKEVDHYRDMRDYDARVRRENPPFAAWAVKHNRTVEGYRILPEPEGQGVRGASWHNVRDWKYFNLGDDQDHFSDGVAGFDTSEYPPEEHLKWAFGNLNRQMQYEHEDWFYLGIVATVYLGDMALAQDSCWGFESDAGDYLEDSIKDIVNNALSLAHGVLQETIDALYAKISKLATVNNITKEEWDRQTALQLETGEWIIKK